MEVLQRSLNDERCLWMRMKEEEEKFCGYTHLEVVDGRANFVDKVVSKIFIFLESYSDNYLQNNLKQRKTNKTKAVKCVGCLPRSARLRSLS